jgi:hypothetical protein
MAGSPQKRTKKTATAALTGRAIWVTGGHMAEMGADGKGEANFEQIAAAPNRVNGIAAERGLWAVHADVRSS